MASNRNQHPTTNSSIFKPSIIILITLAILTKPTIQQSVIPATCTYSFDTATGFYTCRLSSGVVSTPTDVLNITGTHQAGRADSDVKIVWYPANNMFYLNGDILKKFENLVIFKLDSIALQEIGPDAFEYCPNLEQFVSKLSNLTTYPPQMMKNCQKLKVFKSIEQELIDIPELFGDITSLEELDLSDNRLLSISENLVKNMPNLRIFNVQDNRLTQLPQNFFENCQNLEEVEVSNNRFNDSAMITRAFNGNTNLKKLGLDAFGIANFDFQFFSQFAKLDMLNIGITFLTQISWQSLPSSLTVLTVDSIAEEIPENSLNHLVNLSTLSLSGSGITNLHKDTFKAQTELKILSIEWTSLTSLHPELFANQGNLIDLNLRYNKIEGLPVGIFVPLVNLGMTNYLYGINMYSNKIKRLNKISFGDHPHLKYLDFGNNQIDSIQSGIFSKFNSSIYRANFIGNVCINKQFTNAVNLDADEDLKWCFDSWEGITTTSTTTTSTTRAPPTTPGGAGNNFKKIEIFVILLIGFVGILINFI